MKYQDLYDYWIESHSKPTPEGFADIKESNGYKGRFMSPEDIMAFLNAGDPYDLYNNPNIRPMGQFNYPTTAINQGWQSRLFNNKPNNYAMLVSSNPRTELLKALLSKVNTQGYEDIPDEFKKFIPQAIYQHEQAHYNDPRISYKNQGYITKNRHSGEIASREAPARLAEDMYWDRKLRR